MAELDKETKKNKKIKCHIYVCVSLLVAVVTQQKIKTGDLNCCSRFRMCCAKYNRILSTGSASCISVCRNDALKFDSNKTPRYELEDWLTRRDAASVRIKLKASATQRHHRERAARARWLAILKVRFLYGLHTCISSERSMRLCVPPKNENSG